MARRATPGSWRATFAGYILPALGEDARVGMVTADALRAFKVELGAGDLNRRTCNRILAMKGKRPHVVNLNPWAEAALRLAFAAGGVRPFSYWFALKRWLARENDYGARPLVRGGRTCFFVPLRSGEEMSRSASTPVRLHHSRGDT